MWFDLSEDSFNLVTRALRLSGEPDSIALAEGLVAVKKGGGNDAAYRSAAGDPFDEQYTIDDDAPVRVVEDGAQVMAWVFVTDGEADLCSECRASLDDGEGYDGMCGDCADQDEEEGRADD